MYLKMYQDIKSVVLEEKANELFAISGALLIDVLI